MHALYLLSVWLHILAAVVWAGGMYFLVLVVVPWLRRGQAEQGASMLRETGERFRTVSWACFALLLLTGSFNLWARGVRASNFTEPGWLGTPFGHVAALKLALFAIVLGVSAYHDFYVGPRATRALERDPRSAEAGRLRRAASFIGRGNALLALALIALGVMLVRGVPRPP